MLRDEDVDAAVDAGIITAGQARAMAEIAISRRKARSFVRGGEERFRLLGGFNDLFIAIGVLLVGVGLLYGATIVVPWTPAGLPKLSAFAALLAAWFTCGLLVMWGLAEYLTGRLRLVAPSILIVIFLALLASAASTSWFGYLFAPDLGMGSARGRVDTWTSFGLIMASTLAPLAMVGVHYQRFKLPFSLFVLACAAVILVIALYSAIMDLAFRGQPGGVGQHLKWVVFALGLAIFTWAMWFDTSDPERTSRRSDCGFWLHLLAAPLIVHPLAGPLINHPFFPDYSKVGAAATGNAGMVFVLVAVLSAVALIVDRRALLVAGLGYLGAAMAYSLSQLAGGVSSGPATVLGLGVLIIVLGVGWRGIRGALMRALPETSLMRFLPPFERR